MFHVWHRCSTLYLRAFRGWCWRYSGKYIYWAPVPSTYNSFLRSLYLSLGPFYLLSCYLFPACDQTFMCHGNSSECCFTSFLLPVYFQSCFPMQAVNHWLHKPLWGSTSSLFGLNSFCLIPSYSSIFFTPTTASSLSAVLNSFSFKLKPMPTSQKWMTPPHHHPLMLNLFEWWVKWHGHWLF